MYIRSQFSAPPSCNAIPIGYGAQTYGACSVHCLMTVCAYIMSENSNATVTKTTCHGLRFSAEQLRAVGSCYVSLTQATLSTCTHLALPLSSTVVSLLLCSLNLQLAIGSIYSLPTDGGRPVGNTDILHMAELHRQIIIVSQLLKRDCDITFSAPAVPWVFLGLAPSCSSLIAVTFVTWSQKTCDTNMRAQDLGVLAAVRRLPQLRQI